MTGAARRLVLLGAGHANLLALKAYARRRWRCQSITLVSESPWHAYSGMVPGFLAGRYTVEDVSIDLARLAADSGASFVIGRATQVSATDRSILLDDGRVLPFEVASVAIGSQMVGTALPGVRTHAHGVKPLSRLARLAAAFDSLSAASRPDRPRVLVVGAGAAGVEVALALRARSHQHGGQPCDLALVDARPAVSIRSRPRARQLWEAALARASVDWLEGAEVVGAESGRLELRDGRRIPFDLLVWTTGAAPPALFKASGLPIDGQGFLIVDEHLQVPSVPGLFAAGDSAAPAAYPHTPKAGVFAVRMGEVLRHNLETACRGGPVAALRVYRPQARYLSLLDTGDGEAIASWGGFSVAGRAALYLKRRIDRRFIAQFHGSPA